MAKLPVDVSRINIIAASGVVSPVMPWVDGVASTVQDRTPEGVPLWKTQVLITTAEGMELASIKFPAATAPVVEMNKPLTVTDLVATPSVNGAGRAITYFAAGSVIVQTAKREHSGN